MTNSLDAARLQFIAERGLYKEAAAIVAKALEQEFINNQISGEVSHRAKEVSSFVKKALVKKYSDPWKQVTDKAGVRVVFDRPSAIDAGLEVVRDLFPEAVIQDERNLAGEEDRLKYPKVHIQVRVADIRGATGDIECEIQLRTTAQDLWSRMSHTLLYKPMAPAAPDVRRSLYRLLALVELYDSEVERGMTAMASNPAFRESQLLHEAESAFHAFVASDYQLELSQEVIPILAEVIQEGVPAYKTTLAAFVEENREKLASVYYEYGPESSAGQEGQYPLAGQPESILIFERLAVASELLRAKWDVRLPAEWLTDMAGIWGVDLE